MKLALDTNRYTDFQRGVPGVAEVLENAPEVMMPFVVLGELRAGFSLGRKGRENERLLHTFLDRPRVTMLFADDQTTRHFATLYRQLREQGTPIPDNDMWLAALVVQHRLTLFTRDGHFEHLPQISRI
jgi:tRNA(fMet)-specific endonuclease VapC